MAHVSPPAELRSQGRRVEDGLLGDPPVGDPDSSSVIQQQQRNSSELCVRNFRAGSLQTYTYTNLIYNALIIQQRDWRYVPWRGAERERIHTKQGSAALA